ncbi:MAG: hypothetical protein ACKVRN_07770 [Pyrinomonadaceae bacterium]
MKTIQKLEVGFGLATLVGTLTFFCSIVLRYSLERIADDGWKEVEQILPAGFVFIILPGLMVGIGSVTHAVKQRFVGFILVLLGGITLVLCFGLLTVFVISKFQDYGLIFNTIVVLSFVSAILTTFFAILFAIRAKNPKNLRGNLI